MNNNITPLYMNFRFMGKILILDENDYKDELHHLITLSNYVIKQEEKLNMLDRIHLNYSNQIYSIWLDGNPVLGTIRKDYETTLYNLTKLFSILSKNDSFEGRLC